jgi:23S rRNA pseudouridine2605 synthase
LFNPATAFYFLHLSKHHSTFMATRKFEGPRRGDSSSNSRGDRGGRFERRDDSSKKDFKSKFKRSSSSTSGDEKPAYRAEKKPFGDSPRGDDKGFRGERKRFDSKGPGGPDKPFRKPYGKPSFDKDKKFEKRDDDRGAGRGFKKPFGKPAFGRDEKRASGPGRFSKDRKFEKRDDDRGAGRGFKKPFGKPSFGRDEKREAGSDKPFRKPYGKPSFDKDEKPAGSKRFERGAPTRNFDKPNPGSEKFFRGKPFGKPERRRSDEEGGGERRSFTPRRRGVSVKKSDQVAQKASDGTIRLNKFISNSGVCSRREADELIKMGLITVNGQSITEMGHKVKPGDDVRHEGRRLTAEKPVYILMNKPKGYITTTDDPQERKTVMALLANTVKERVYPVGRLDRNTTGLLLLTNDGELADRLTHPSYNAKKIYKVELDKPITKADFEKIQEGVRLEEGKAVVDDLAMIDDDKKTLGIELHIGWNRIVRRIFESLGYEVVRLDRVVYAGLDKKNIGRGEWRFLKETEVVKLKHFGQDKTVKPTRGVARLKKEE